VTSAQGLELPWWPAWWLFAGPALRRLDVHFIYLPFSHGSLGWRHKAPVALYKWGGNLKPGKEDTHGENNYPE
jgi:hypothetical protein